MIPCCIACRLVLPWTAFADTGKQAVPAICIRAGKNVHLHLAPKATDDGQSGVCQPANFALFFKLLFPAFVFLTSAIMQRAGRAFGNLSLDRNVS